MKRILDRLADMPKTTRDLILLESGLLTYSWAFRPDDYLARMTDFSDSAIAEMEEATIRLSTTQPPLVPAVNPIPQQDRARYLEELVQVFREIGEDKGLSDEDRAHFVSLVRSLGSALQDETEQGPEAVEKAAKFAFVDAVQHPGPWERARNRPWAKRLSRVIAGVLMTLAAIGGYGDAKELAQDIWDATGPVIIQILPSDEAGQDGVDTIDGEILPEDPEEPLPDQPR